MAKLEKYQHDLKCPKCGQSSWDNYLVRPGADMRTFVGLGLDNIAMGWRFLIFTGASRNPNIPITEKEIMIRRCYVCKYLIPQLPLDTTEG